MTEAAPPDYNQGEDHAETCTLVFSEGARTPDQQHQTVQALIENGVSVGLGFSGTKRNVLFAFCGSPAYAGLLVEALRIAIARSDDFRNGVRDLVGDNGHPVTGDLNTFQKITIQ
ncbi:MAG: hypothetical protein R3E87_14975 [Burkholderiaceae bacterium]